MDILPILRGRFDKLPKQRSKAVKIFLSSTFSDTHTERDYLIEHIYPKLKTYCKLEHGLDFYVIISFNLETIKTVMFLMIPPFNLDC
jgi:hypothetical protein